MTHHSEQHMHAAHENIFQRSLSVLATESKDMGGDKQVRKGVFYDWEILYYY